MNELQKPKKDKAMKKIRLIMTLMVLMPFSRAFAQVGEIIYRDFEPDSILIYWHKLGPVWIDLDVDGEADDLMMRMYISGDICYPAIFAEGPNIRICPIDPSITDIVLSEVEEEDWTTYVGWGGGSGSMAGHYSHYGFRIQREDGYYYGWFETYNRYVKRNNNENQEAHYGFDRTAYCTIPDYPLHWGQTDLEDVGENQGKSFVQIHPNPATGLVHITGTEAAEIHVFNPIGQLVRTVQSSNEISLENLPQGIYLLRITTTDGKVFSDKIIKE